MPEFWLGFDSLGRTVAKATKTNMEDKVNEYELKLNRKQLWAIQLALQTYALELLSENPINFDEYERVTSLNDETWGMLYPEN